MTVAFDIETVPLPMETYTERQRRRWALLVEKEGERLPADATVADLPDVHRKVASLHAHLGRVCCVSLAWHARPEAGETEWAVNPARDPYFSRSFAAPGPDDEEAMLVELWSWLEGVGVSRVVGFNSKRFDAPFLKVRSLRHAVALPSCWRLFAESRAWLMGDHADLQACFPRGYGLADACEVLGVETPKGDIDGSQVAACVEAGEIDRVVRYCEADARATLQCLDVLQHLGGLQS